MVKNKIAPLYKLGGGGILLHRHPKHSFEGREGKMIILYTSEDVQLRFKVSTYSSVTHPKVLLPRHLLNHHVIDTQHITPRLQPLSLWKRDILLIPPFI